MWTLRKFIVSHSVVILRDDGCDVELSVSNGDDRTHLLRAHASELIDWNNGVPIIQILDPQPEDHVKWMSNLDMSSY